MNGEGQTDHTSEPIDLNEKGGKCQRQVAIKTTKDRGRKNRQTVGKWE